MYSEYQFKNYLSKVMTNIAKRVYFISMRCPQKAFLLIRYLSLSKKAVDLSDNVEGIEKHVPLFILFSCYYLEHSDLNGNRGVDQGFFYEKEKQLTLADWNRIFSESERMGAISGLLSGKEALPHSDMIKSAIRHKRMIFTIFMEEELYEDIWFEIFRKNFNLLPVISIPGNEAYTDAIKGSCFYEKRMLLMKKMQRYCMPFGISITVSKDNLCHSMDYAFLSEIYKLGCIAVYFVDDISSERPSSDEMSAVGLDEYNYTLMDKLRLLRLQYEDMLFIHFPNDINPALGCVAAGKESNVILSHTAMIRYVINDL